MSTSLYIYGLACPRTGEIRYVGKAVSIPSRLYGHMRDAKKGRLLPVSRWIRGLGQEPTVVVLEENPADWQEAERRWIAHGREQGWGLLNIQDGGEGGYNGQGWSDAARKAAAASLTREQRAENARRSMAARRAIPYKESSKESS